MLVLRMDGLAYTFVGATRADEKQKHDTIIGSKVYLTSPGPSEIGHNSFISHKTANTSGFLVGFRVYISLSLNPYRSKDSCMSHKESIRMPLTTRYLNAYIHALEKFRARYARRMYEGQKLRDILAKAERYPGY